MKNLTTLFLSFVATASMMANISSSEKEALVKLYKTTNGSQWTNKWDLNTPVDSWYGVKIQNDKVIALNLSSNHLVGQFAKRTRKLGQLTKFELIQKRYLRTYPDEHRKFETIENLKYCVQ